MNEICKWMLAAALVCSVAACSDEKSEITSGGGSVIASDGGASSAKFAGTYKGMITTLLKGSAIDDRTSTDEIVIVVRTNGTASLTIDGETVEGNVNDNRLGFSIRIIEEDGLVKCDGNATVTGTISGNVASGNVIGSGGCDALAASTGLDITGSYTASKTN
jgi:hypothetical protein